MEKQNRSFDTPSSNEDDIANPRFARSVQEDNVSDSVSQVSNVLQHIIQDMHNTYLDLAKHIEMQKHDTEKEYHQEIDKSLNILNEQFYEALALAENCPDIDTGQNATLEAKGSITGLVKQKAKYMQMYDDQTNEVNRLMCQQRDGVEALARLKVEYEEYKRAKEKKD